MKNLKPDQAEYLELLRNGITYLPREVIEQYLTMSTENVFILSNALLESCDRVNILSKLGLSLVEQLEKDYVNG